MKKFLKVFYSQIFNSFFPIIIVLILINISKKNDITTIFLLLNYANVYLLFSDYSSNIVFLKEAVTNGGVNKHTASSTIKNINAYIVIKWVVLGAGFFIWILLCLTSPILSIHFFSSLLSYTFIIGYNFNFYWIYISSSRELYFIISNLIARLLLLILLLTYLYFKINLYWLMPIVGVANIATSFLYFKKFCKKNNIEINLNKQVFIDATFILKRDLPVMANNFLLLSPTIFLSFFIGFIKNVHQIVVYSLAEKIFMALRGLLSVFTNSLYPVVCEPNSLNKARKKTIFITFYALVLGGCLFIYLTSNLVVSIIKQPILNDPLFDKCLLYLLITIVITSINSPLILWLLIKNQIGAKRTFYCLLIASITIFIIFFLNSLLNNGVMAATQSVLFSEFLIVLTLFLLYQKNNSTTFSR